MDSFRQFGGEMNMKIVIPIVIIIIISSILGGIYYFFIRKKATSPAPAPVQVSVPAPAPILKYPQLTDGSSNTWTISGRPYGNGTYIATASSIRENININDNFNPYQAFDGIISQENSGSNKLWHSQQLGYIFETGVYNGTNTLQGISGEWITIKLPTQITLRSYKIYGRNDYGVDTTIGNKKWWELRTPKEFVILGSNDGTTWSIVDDRRGNNKAPNWTSVSQEFTISNNTTKYNNYAMVITKVGNDDIVSHRNNVNIQEWELYGY